MLVLDNFQFGTDYKKIEKKNIEAKRSSIQEQINGLIDSKEQGVERAPLVEEKAVVTDISEEMQEKSKQFKISMIIERMKGGTKLSPKEEKFLEEHAPGAYKMAMEVKKERLEMETELKSCKSKKQVKALMERKTFMFMGRLKEAIKVDNRGEVERLTTIHNNIKDEHKQFTKTQAYEILPERSDDDDKKIDYGKKQEKISKEDFVDFVKKHYGDTTDEVGAEDKMLEMMASLFIEDGSEGIVSESVGVSFVATTVDTTINGHL